MVLNQRVAIVTGAAAGIGRAASMLFAREGATVECVDRDLAGAEGVCEEIRSAGFEAFARECDVAVESDVERTVKAIAASQGRIDILFNNAGIVAGGKIHEMTTESWDSSFAVNVRSMFLMSRAVIPHFLSQGGGVILNTSSVAALRAVADRAAYSATKGAVLALTRSMALDYAKANIRVNCLCPGTVDTPSLHGRLGDDPETWRKFEARQPLGRLGTAEEIARAALYLVSDDASFVTGSAFQIDGGMGL